MYDYSHQWIGNPLKFCKTQSVEPIGERASSKLRCLVTAGSYVATKPKARFPNGFFAFCLTRTPHVSKRLTCLRGRTGYTVRLRTRGQFPNNLCDWSNREVEGLNESWHHDTPLRVVKYLISSYSMLGVGGSLGEIKRRRA